MSESEKLKSPIFVIGTNRAGKELFIKLVAYHEDFAWLSNYHMRFPKNLRVSYLNRILDFPLFNSKIKYKKGFPKPSSSYLFWNTLFEGFRKPFRDLRADDVNPMVKRKIRETVSRILKYEGKKVFLAQYSGWSRIGFFKEIFPNAKFIHVVRDGRAVANSLTNYEGWEGWRGVYNWRLGYIPAKEEMTFLDSMNWSFYAIAALEWKTIVNNIINVSAKLPADDFITVRYEDLVETPDEIVKKVMKFCGVSEISKRYIRHRKTIKIINANEKSFRIPSWKKNLSPDVIEKLTEFLSDELKYYSYLE